MTTEVGNRSGQHSQQSLSHTLHSTNLDDVSRDDSIENKVNLQKNETKEEENFKLTEPTRVAGLATLLLPQTLKSRSSAHH